MDFVERTAKPTSGWFLVAVGLVVVIGVGIHLGAFGAPLAVDDYAQRDMCVRDGPFNLFDFINDANRSHLLAQGAIPWWSHPQIAVRFLRPVASALTWIDCRVFKSDPVVPHVLSFLCWGAAVISVARLFRNVMSERAALFGAAVFALSPCHSTPLVWLANRSVLIAVAFGCWGLDSYLKWRAQPTRTLGIKTATLFLLAHLSGEYAIGFAAYVLAIEVSRKNETLHRRGVLVLPALVPGAFVVLGTLLLGYGPRHTGYYSNPFQDPLSFAKDAPSKLTAILGSAVFGMDDPWLASSEHPFLWALMLALVMLAGTRFLKTRGDVGALWLLGGAVLACVPFLGALSQWRVLGTVMVGFAGYFGAIIDALIAEIGRRLKKPRDGLRATLFTAFLVGVLIIQMVRAPIKARASGAFTVEMATDFARKFEVVRGSVRSGHTTVLLLRAQSPMSVLWTPFIFPERPTWVVASQSNEAIAVVRTGKKSIEIYPERGPLVSCGPHDGLNTRTMSEGEVIQIPGRRVTVLKVDSDGCPARVSVEFEHDLDDPNIVWMVETHAGFEEIARPTVGIGVRLQP